MFDLYATAPQNLSPSDIGEYAKRAELMGFDGLHVSDAVHDGFLMANNALLATQSLKVGIGVLVAFPRSPMTVAIAAWDLQAMSSGRFELGLGSQVKGNIEKRYSTEWHPPAARMSEYIQSLRAIFHSFQTGERLHFEGVYYHFTRLQAFFNPGPIENPHIPILVGAIGPKMTQMAGQFADGMITHPTNTPPAYIKDVCLPRLQLGIEKKTHQGEQCKLMLCCLTATGINNKIVSYEREKQRQLLAFLYSTPAYWPSLDKFGWQDKGEQLLQMTRDGDWASMNTVINDAMLDTFVASGPYDKISDIIKSRYQGLSTRITFPLPDEPRHDKAASQVVAELKSM